MPIIIITVTIMTAVVEFCGWMFFFFPLSLDAADELAAKLHVLTSQTR